MEKAKVILVDTDEMYLMPLERRFIDEFEAGTDIGVITDMEYLKEFFSEPQSMDVLVIDEKAYNQDMQRHTIGNIFILAEKAEQGSQEKGSNLSYISKYTSVMEICREVLDNMSTDISGGAGAKETTRVIMVYSPVGGIGKTTVSIGLSGALAQKHKKVLFMGTDTLQTFGIFNQGNALLGSGAEKAFLSHGDNIYEEVRASIYRDGFSILPQFMSSLSSLSITGSDYLHLIEKIKAAGDYDYILIDSGSEFTEHTSKLMGKADYKLILTGQDQISAYKLSCLLHNIDCSDTNRYVFACNKYRSDLENVLVSPEYLQKCRIKEYVEYEPEIDYMDKSQIAGIKSIQALAFSFI